MYEQTFSQYSKWKKCSTKWRTYEFTAEKWEIKLLSIVTELSQLLSFFCLLCKTDAEKEHRQTHETQSTTGPAQRTQLVYTSLDLDV